MSSRIWLITGCSTGFGRELAQVAAAHGDQVVGTLRQADQIAAFEALAPGQLKGILMDVTQPEQVAAGVQATLSAFGRVDVLVNNAGYGSMGTVEETPETEARRQFEVNFFGTLALTRAVLPHMRQQGRGHILNITSIAGLRGTPGLGLYNASKFALEGLGEALAKEVGPLGIHVTNVEPGPFRTDWAGRSATKVPIQIEAYQQTAARFFRYIDQAHGNQPGDPRRAAEAMYALTQLDQPPVHLPLGAMAYRGAREKAQAFLAELDQFEDLGLPTDFPAEE